MNFQQWLTANGYDEAELNKPENARQKTHLEAAWKAETAPPPPVAKETPFDEQMKAIEAENKRQQEIHDATVKVAERHVGNPEKVKQVRALCELAIEDKRMDARDFKMKLLHLDREVGPMILTPRPQQVTGDVLEAAVCMAGGLETVEKEYDERTLTAAHKEFRGGLGLQSLITICARRNGWTGHDFKSDWYGAVRAACPSNGGGANEMYAAATGPSTYTLPNIFANIANKFLRVGFDAIDDTWSRVSTRRSFNDFKAATTVALTGAFQYRKLPPSGEIKHGVVGEIAYTNKADTYAIMLGIDRQSLVNDDLGALTGAGRRMGRGAALSLNDTFWTVFLNNSTFFAAGNNNVISGATTAMDATNALEALRQADATFRLQTDPDGKPLGIMARTLLVPPARRIMALNAMNSTVVVGSTGPTPANNAFVGAYNVESSPYMQNSSYTGNSSTAWYLLADPNDLPVIEVGFLNGQESPTVETNAMEFNMLGVTLRGYYDYGVSLQEFRAGVRSAGA